MRLTREIAGHGRRLATESLSLPAKSLRLPRESPGRLRVDSLGGEVGGGVEGGSRGGLGLVEEVSYEEISGLSGERIVKFSD